MIRSGYLTLINKPNKQHTSSTDTLVIESATKIVFRMSRWMTNFRFRWSLCMGPCRTRYSRVPSCVGMERTRWSLRHALMVRSCSCWMLPILGRLVKLSPLLLLPSLFSSTSRSSSELGSRARPPKISVTSASAVSASGSCALT